MADTVALAYSYLAPSSVVQVPDGIRMALETSGGAAAHPQLFEGWVTDAGPAAAALLVLARIARTRYYTPPAMVARLVAAADPVVTTDGERIRFESFSLCNGVYGRLDIEPAALDGRFLAAGTTNVDFGPDMRQALTAVGAEDHMHMSVGASEVDVRTRDHHVVERRVDLPVRWIKALSAVQVVQSTLIERITLDRAGATRFLRGVPSTPMRGSVRVETSAGSARIGHGRTGVVVGGIERIRCLLDLALYATGLRLFGSETPDSASAWVLDLHRLRFTLAISPDRSRGFSGEGALLESLAARRGDALDAASGRLGFDLHQQRFFSRDLPFRHDGLGAVEPRLDAARALVDSGAVRVLSNGEVAVASNGVEHRVRWSAEGAHCTCPWLGRHGRSRGPCKHVLAAGMVAR